MLIYKVFKNKGLTGRVKMALQYVCGCSGSLDIGNYVSLPGMIKLCHGLEKF